MNTPIPQRITMKVRRTRRSSNPLPRYHSEHAAGMDLAADIDEPMTLHSLERVAIATGIAIEIPPGYEGQVRPRSGRAFKDGLALANSPGTIDADYRGEIRVILVNLGAAPLTIKPGERIAQLVIAPVVRAELVETEELEESGRAEGGFGHTGR
ncbi:MAG: dUTP diphosphatase [Candidatus Binataceae bacterium]